MNWTKIPTDLLKQRIPDNEILAIVKYQMLWADLEYQPDDKTALRYITNKQLSIVKQWLDTIEVQVTSDINSANKNRHNRKISYRKNNDLDKNVTITVTDTVQGSVIDSVETVDKIRLDKNKKEIKKKNIYGSEEPTDVQDYFLSRWNETVENTGISKISIFSEERKSKFESILAVYKKAKGLEETGKELSESLLSFIRDCYNYSSFLRGETEHNFKFGVDFVLQKSSFIKMMEGKYADK